MKNFNVWLINFNMKGNLNEGMLKNKIIMKSVKKKKVTRLKKKLIKDFTICWFDILNVYFWKTNEIKSWSNYWHVKVGLIDAIAALRCCLTWSFLEFNILYCNQSIYVKLSSLFPNAKAICSISKICLIDFILCWKLKLAVDLIIPGPKKQNILPAEITSGFCCL